MPYPMAWYVSVVSSHLGLRSGFHPGLQQQPRPVRGHESAGHWSCRQKQRDKLRVRESLGVQPGSRCRATDTACSMPMKTIRRPSPVAIRAVDSPEIHPGSSLPSFEIRDPWSPLRRVEPIRKERAEPGVRVMVLSPHDGATVPWYVWRDLDADSRQRLQKSLILERDWGAESLAAELVAELKELGLL